MKTIRKAIFIVVFALIAGTAFSQIKADATGWKKNDFTKDWKDYEWTFSTSTLKAGENTIIFTYTSGAHKLCLKDVVIKADGNAIAFYPEMRSAGSNPTEIFYAISVPKGTKKLEFLALAHTAGGNDSNGTITVSMQDDGTLEGIAARIMTESSNAALAPANKWDKDTFTMKDVRRRWDFSEVLSSEDGEFISGDEYTVSFLYTTDEVMPSLTDTLYLSDVMFFADGKLIQYFPETQSTKLHAAAIEYTIEVPKGTKKLEMSALARNKAGTGIISVTAE